MRRLATLVISLAAAIFALPAIPAQAAPTIDWLCRPGLADDPCEIPLDTTVEQQDGSLVVETPERLPIEERPVDCFYVYPTVSSKLNAPAVATPEVKTIAKYQAARYSSVCRTYAPLYRQVSLPSLVFGPLGSATKAYEDVLAAWKQYLAQDNDGRGVILIGHGEGAALLRKLVQEEIDDDAAVRDRLVAAVLLGGNVWVGKGEYAGYGPGDFQNVPPCLNFGGGAVPGCVIALSSYAKDPAPLLSPFGNSYLDPMTLAFGLHGTKDGYVLCTDVPNLYTGLIGKNTYQRITVPVERFGSGAVIGAKQLGQYAQVSGAQTTWVTTKDAFQGYCTHGGLDFGLNVWRYFEAPWTSPNLPPQWPVLGGTHYFDANLGLDVQVAVVDKLTDKWVASH